MFGHDGNVFALHAPQGFNGEWYIYLFRFVLLFSYIIPISLRVNLDMGKTYCSRQMQHGMYLPPGLFLTPCHTW